MSGLLLLHIRTTRLHSSKSRNRNPYIARYGPRLFVQLSDIPGRSLQRSLSRSFQLRLGESSPRLNIRYIRADPFEWLINFEFLNATIVSLPIHVYFVRRACLLWNRSIWVWWPCIVLTAVAHILFGTRYVSLPLSSNLCQAYGPDDSCLMGLHAPWGFKLLSDTEIMRWLPVFGDQVWQTWPVRLAGVYSLLGESTSRRGKQQARLNP